MITVKMYESKDKQTWDEFVRSSKNGVFFFMRDYMEYHSDRFEDLSLIFRKNGKLIAIMPANIQKETLQTHAGLTFGGILTNKKIKTAVMLDIFRALKDYLRNLGFKKISYKAIPHIYHDDPAEEDLYTLTMNNAELVRRDVSSAINLQNGVNFSKGRKRNIKTCKEMGITVKRSYNFKEYMSLKKVALNDKYGKDPVHSGEEMQLLADMFPENIKLFTAEHEEDSEVYAGVVMYESKNVAHAQYLAATNEGVKIGASNLIFDFLIRDYYKDKKYFDFGISTEDNGNYLNEGLIDFKERFGASAVVHDFYEVSM